MAFQHEGYALTAHAKLRRKQMGITEDRLAEVMRAPVMDLPSRQDPHRRLAFSEDLVIVYEPRCLTVVTVLWRSDEKYQQREEDVMRK